MEETPSTRAGYPKPARRFEPRSGERVRGPQHQVKLAASTDEQSGSRAAHVTAKAVPLAQEPERAGGPGGVGSAARVQGRVRNTGGPSARPTSGRSAPYKPVAKSVAAQRESEGIVVPGIAATNNAAELIDQLTLYMNKVRQAAITKEIIEVVSGAASAG